MSTKQDPPEVAEFHKELYSLFDSRTASASKIDRLTKLAFKSAKYYKNVVYHLEKFITRCVPEYKLTGLYVLDSICRTSQSVKTKSSSGSFSGSEYVARFEKNIEALFAEFCKVQEDKEKEKVKRVVDLWERSGTFSATVIENIKTKYFPLLETKADQPASTPSSSTAQTTGTTDDNAADKAASFISSLAASLGQGSGNGSLTTHPTSSFNLPPLPIPATMTGANGMSMASSLAYGTTASQNPESEKLTPSSTANRPSAPGSTVDNPLLGGISDPSSALALQTLLATVSQVKAATAATGAAGAGAGAGVGAGAAGNPFLGYPTAPGASMQAPPPFPPPTHALPPVLQQLQGVLSNSNQNGAFLPNNNTMVSSTVASSFLQSGGQQGGGSNDGSGGMNGGPAPRDPRVDPRVDPRLDPRLVNRDVAQHGQQGHQGQQAPPLAPPHGQAPMFGAPASIHPSMLPPGAALAGSNAPGLLGPGFDGETMARLASLLNHSNDPSKASHLPVGPGSFATGPVSLPVHLPGRAPQDAGRPEPTEDSPLRGHPSLPSRPRMAPDPFQQRPNEVNGNFPSPMDESPSNKREFPVVTEDPTAGPDQIRVISRTLWVGGGFVPTIPEPELEEIFAVKGKISTIMINPSKFNAFIKMVDRPQAERCKAELDRTTVHGEVMKVGWGCGFGPRDCFDYTAGTSLIPIDRLTDTDRRWLSNSVVGGFGPRERIRGGVVILEPNIEPVAPDGREALPRKSRNPGSIGGTPAAGGRGGRGSGASGGGSGGGGVSGGSGSGSGSGPGRGRGRGGPMSTDQQDTAGGPRGRGMGTGRGRGLEEPDQQQWSHPLPHRPQTTQVGFQGQQGQGPTWGGKRDSGQNHIQDQDAGPFQQQQDEETRRSKKSRWE